MQTYLAGGGGGGGSARSWCSISRDRGTQNDINGESFTRWNSLIARHVAGALYAVLVEASAHQHIERVLRPAQPPRASTVRLSGANRRNGLIRCGLSDLADQIGSCPTTAHMSYSAWAPFWSRAG
jgi:hypothetical protein